MITDEELLEIVESINRGTRIDVEASRRHFPVSYIQRVLKARGYRNIWVLDDIKDTFVGRFND